MTEAAPSSPTDPLYAKRQEDKYIVPLKAFDRVLSEVEKRLDPYYPAKSTEFTQQRSVYYETPDLQFIRNHLKEIDTRYKVRRRFYGPNGKWSTEPLLEVKYRTSGDQKKLRIRLDPLGYAMIRLIGRKPLPAKIAKLNEDLPDGEYQKAAQIVNRLFSKYQLDQISEVEYRRLSFSNSKGTVRLTIDTELKVASVAPNKVDSRPIKSDGLWDNLQEYDKKFNPDLDFIVELKHAEDTGVPAWFQNLMDREDDKFEGFSKYAYSLSQVLK